MGSSKQKRRQNVGHSREVDDDEEDSETRVVAPPDVVRTARRTVAGLDARWRATLTRAWVKEALR